MTRNVKRTPKKMRRNMSGGTGENKPGQSLLEQDFIPYNSSIFSLGPKYDEEQKKLKQEELEREKREKEQLGIITAMEEKLRKEKEELEKLKEKQAEEQNAKLAVITNARQNLVDNVTPVMVPKKAPTPQDYSRFLEKQEGIIKELKIKFDEAIQGDDQKAVEDFGKKLTKATAKKQHINSKLQQSIENKPLEDKKESLKQQSSQNIELLMSSIDSIDDPIPEELNSLKQQIMLLKDRIKSESSQEEPLGESYSQEFDSVIGAIQSSSIGRDLSEKISSISSEEQRINSERKSIQDQLSKNEEIERQKSSQRLEDLKQQKLNLEAQGKGNVKSVDSEIFNIDSDIFASENDDQIEAEIKAEMSGESGQGTGFKTPLQGDNEISE